MAAHNMYHPEIIVPESHLSRNVNLEMHVPGADLSKLSTKILSGDTNPKKVLKHADGNFFKHFNLL